MSGFGTAGGANQFLEGLRPASNITEFAQQSAGDAFRNKLISGAQKGVDFLQSSQSVLRPGGEALGLKSGITAAALPASQAVGDTMFAEATRLNKQQIIDDALAALDEGATNADRALAIRTAMLQYGFDEDEITATIASAGYKAGGRVGYRFGGIDAAIDKVEDEDIKDSVKMVADMPDMDLMDLIEEFEIIFKRKPMSMEELKQFYRETYEMESPVRLKEKIKEKFVVEAKDGGLMDLGGKEMYLRGGGFVPIGKKERADDVPARLSKNEFVMTADAVRAAGGGSVNKGAKRMYDLMNNLEARA